MRPPADLDDIQWHTLTHAYGTAEDVPALIRALYEGGEQAQEALGELYGTVYHQGSVYEASAPAVPFLAHAARHAPAQRASLLMLLAALADHTPRTPSPASGPAARSPRSAPPRHRRRPDPPGRRTPPGLPQRLDPPRGGRGPPLGDRLPRPRGPGPGGPGRPQPGRARRAEDPHGDRPVPRRPPSRPPRTALPPPPPVHRRARRRRRTPRPRPYGAHPWRRAAE
ncbi:hypothetical protein F3K43_00060 [Streptomyces sp. LBUM 1476]|nr:hypothetical protein [Streptomyces sp. LBUM 1476]